MKLLMLLERKNYDKKHICKTPGAIYSTKLSDDSVSIKVELPKHAEVPESEEAAKELEVDLHYAVEQVLARLFPKNAKDSKE